MKIRFYYTLKDIYTEYLANGFNKLFFQWTGSYDDTVYTSILFEDISLNYGDDNIVYIDVITDNCFLKRPEISEVLANPDLKKQIVKFINKMHAWLDDSKFRYEKLIELYEANSDNLLKQIEAFNTVKFNDTPQTTTDGLDGDNYATTYTVNKSGTDASTLMSRLSEIRNAWNSLYEEWTKEFARKFVLY